MNEAVPAFPRGLRVLVVEDEALIADEIEDRLTRLGCIVVGVADTAADALAIAGRERPDIALMDIRIKGADDGIEAARQVHERHDVPVVFLTAHSDRATLDRALATLPFGYVLKPFKEQDLLLAMELATFRCAVERGLRQSSLTREAMLDGVHEGVLVVDAGQHVRYMNSSAERATGWALGAALGRPVCEVLTLQDEHDGHDLLPALLEPEGEGGAMVPCRQVARDGMGGPVEASAKPLVHLGVRTGIAITLHDVAQRRRIEALEAENLRVLEASRLKGLFLANMSHELRTPLNAVIGFAEVLGSGMVPRDSPQHDEYLGLIARSGRHLLQVINDVLDLSKIEAGRLEFQATDIYLRPLVEDVVQTLAMQADERRLALHFEVAPELARVRLDGGRLKQVIFNYLSNAIKFTGPGGRVDVRAVAIDGRTWRLEVEDTGVGISTADQAKLFVEFSQLDSSLSRRHQGTGLGLALTRRLVDAQGGRVGVRSAPGVGSCFWAELPRRYPAREDGAPALLLALQRPASRQRVAHALAARGLEAEGAGTVAEIVHLARERRYDGLAVDLSLGDGCGLNALAELRADGASRQAAVCAVALDAGADGAVAFAVDEIVAKPLQPEAFARTLERLRPRIERLRPRLDRQRTTQTTPPRATRTPAPGTADVMRVLVVDDEHAARELMRATLVAAGFGVVTVDSGAAALAALETVRPAAMVLDLMMPEMDGFQVLDALRRDPTWSSLPVLVWTAMSLSEVECLRLRQSARMIAAKGERDAVRVLSDALLDWARDQVPPAERRA